MFSQLLRNSWQVLLLLALAACSDTSTSTSTSPSASASDRKNIVVFGASGVIGGLIVTDALESGHNVIGISRSPERLTIDHPSFTALKGDITNLESFQEVTQGADAIIISVHGAGEDNAPENTVHARSAEMVIAALTGVEGAPYVLQIGGATTMFETKEGVLANAPMPAEEGTEWYALLLGHLVALNAYRDSDIDWTILTPPFVMNGWARNGVTDTSKLGTYRTSTTEIILDEAGAPADIMVADLAAAAVDEIENRHFVRQRFTVAN